MVNNKIIQLCKSVKQYKIAQNLRPELPENMRGFTEKPLFGVFFIVVGKEGGCKQCLI